MKTITITVPGRLDACVAREWSGRGAAKELILQGAVSVNGCIVVKASAKVESGDVVTVTEPYCRYVSRGGVKLEHGLTQFGLDVEGKVCLDVGASTGGFTHCLLQRGAAMVYAVDTGTNQLSDVLREDGRVVSMERTNIRDVDILTPMPEFVCVDVSFVSVTKIADAIIRLLAPGGYGVILIKPQFEAGRANVGKRGVVKDKSAHISAIMHVYDALCALGVRVGAVTPSPIRGGGGNVEYLIMIGTHGYERKDFAAKAKEAVL